MKILIKLFWFLLLSSIHIYATLYKSEKESDSFMRYKRAVIQKKYRLPNPVKIYIGAFLNATTVYLATQRIESYTCIKFKLGIWYIKGPKGFNYKRSHFSSAPFGVKLNDYDYENTIFVHDKFENNVGIVEHLTGKMLGLLYEHDRPDRDDNIKLIHENINPLAINHFERYSKKYAETYGFGYDLHSTLHFMEDSFSLNKKPVIESKRQPYQFRHQMGQLHGLSFSDYRILSKHYCEDECTKNERKKCKNNGYVNPNDCKKCICPFGFTGPTCSDNLRSHKDCSEKNSIIISNKYLKSKKISGKGVCAFLIKSKNKGKIFIKVHKSSTVYDDECYPQKGHEIKHLNDKGVTGLTLCGKNDNFNITSQGSSALIIYNGVSKDSYLEFSFKQVGGKYPKKKCPKKKND